MGLITNPTTCMFGVTVREDGTFENIGIGAFDIDQAEELACRLEAIAKAIGAKASQRSIQLAA